MNGVHDLGGMHGFGPVRPTPGEPVFHATWERRTFALTLAADARRRWNLDMSRDAREQIPPAEYLSATYYERWLFGLEKLLAAHGFLTADELRGDSLGADIDDRGGPVELGADTPTVADVQRFLRHRLRARRDDAVRARFKRGDGVTARNLNPAGHTRLPRYVRGRRGIVDSDHGVFVYPDTNALGTGESPQHLYSICFAACDLWGPEASPRDSVFLDLWDDYLDPA
jgi:nitrile hydratase